MYSLTCLVLFVLSGAVSLMYGLGTGSHHVKMSVMANLLHLCFGVLFCSIPITYGAWLTLQPSVIPPLS